MVMFTACTTTSSPTLTPTSDSLVVDSLVVDSISLDSTIVDSVK